MKISVEKEKNIGVWEVEESLPELAQTLDNMHSKHVALGFTDVPACLFGFFFPSNLGYWLTLR